MKTLLLVGGVLLLLLGLLLLVAAGVAFLIARSRNAKAAGAPGVAPQPQPQHPAGSPGASVPRVPPIAAAPMPRPHTPEEPRNRGTQEPVRVAAAPVAAPSAPARTAASQAVDATVVASKPSWGALHLVSGKVAGQTFPIPADGFYIGRDRVLAQVVVDDPSASKKHVWVGLREGVVTAIDQSSTNGTYLNTIGTRIGQVKLSPGDTLIISDDVARFVYKI